MQSTCPGLLPSDRLPSTISLLTFAKLSSSSPSAPRLAEILVRRLGPETDRMHRGSLSSRACGERSSACKTEREEKTTEIAVRTRDLDWNDTAELIDASSRTVQVTRDTKMRSNRFL